MIGENEAVDARVQVLAMDCFLTASGGQHMSIEHRFVETNGIRMHVAEAGAGRPVLLCHGFPESWYSWRHQLEALAKEGFRAIAPDMCG
jgi:alpha-beta hydrolase superfamily lysophospholipase